MTQDGSDISGIDYIIVGAGSAGAVLADRLSADGRSRVLVLEAGGRDLHPWIRMPIGYGKAFYHAGLNWKFTTAPIPALNNRQSYWPRGKVIGGSSSINAMVWARGHPEDFDDWAMPGWGWDEVGRLYRKIENWQGAPDQIRGHGGPLSVEDISDKVHPLCDAFFAGAAQAGIARNPDYNGASMDGVGHYQLNTRAGFRASTAAAYLRPALKRANVTLECHAQVTRLILAEGRVVGVSYRQRGRDRTVRARGEVILSAGAVMSPVLLMQSGIGPGEVLSDNGIAVAHEATHVGRNLQDHLGADNLYRARVPTLNQVLRPWLGRLRVGLQYLATRNGPLSLSVNHAGGFVRLRGGTGRPDLQLYFQPMSYTRAPVGQRPLMTPDPFPGFLMGFNPCRPTSMGHLTPGGPDPFAAPAIHPNYLDTEEDRQGMINGLRLIRRLAGTAALEAVIDEELAPGVDTVSDEDLLAYARDNAWTVFHPCGTCRMGNDPAQSVVDARLRVHRLEGLRVADASVFPVIPSGNTNAPAIMVGEKAAEMVLEDRA